MQKLKNILIFKYSKIIELLPLALLCSAIGICYYINANHLALWHDELETWNTVTQKNFSQFFTSYFETQAHPPLYFLIQYFFSKFIFISEANLRIISIFGWISGLFVTSSILNKIQGKTTAILYILLLSLDSEIINSALEARPYGLLFLIFSLRLKKYLFEDFDETKKSNFNITLDILLLLTHYYGFFIVTSFRILDFLNNKQKIKFKEISTLSFLTIFFLILVIKDFKHDFYFLNNYYFQDFAYFLSYYSNFGIAIAAFFTFIVHFVIHKDKNSSANRNLYKIIKYLIVLNGLIICSSFILGGWSSAYTLFLKPIYFLMSVLLIFDILQNLINKSNNLHKWGVRLLMSVIVFFLITTNIFQSNITNQIFKKTVSTGYLNVVEVINKQKTSLLETGFISADSTPNAFLFYKNKFVSNKIHHLDLISNKLDWLSLKDRIELALNSGLYQNYYVLLNYSIIGNNLSQLMRFSGFSAKILYQHDDTTLLQYLPQYD